MGVIGPHPASGFRIDLVRQADGPPWLYRGRIAAAAVEAPQSSELVVAVAASGEVVLETDLHAVLAERVRLLIRQVVKHALGGGQPPPRRIQRWRP